MAGSGDDEDNLDSFLKSMKAKSDSSEFKRQVKSAADLSLFSRSQIEILEPEDVELEQELTENVPSGADADEDPFWTFRVRSEVPKEYLGRATVHVSIICTKTSVPSNPSYLDSP